MRCATLPDMAPNTTTPTSSTQATRVQLDAKLAQTRRVRWAVRAALVLGVAASVAANILHARDNTISQVIAAWPPLALLLTVELISRVPAHRRSLAAVRLGATASIAGIAAWVSYWHMVGVVAAYGETGASPYLLPFSVDGLVIVASVCLVELAERLAAQEERVAAYDAEAAAQAARHASDEDAPESDAPTRHEAPDAPDDGGQLDASPPDTDELDERRRARTTQRRRASHGRRNAVSDDAIVEAISTRVVECRRAGVAPTQRELIADVENATGQRVGWKRVVALAELVQDVDAAADAREEVAI